VTPLTIAAVCAGKALVLGGYGYSKRKSIALSADSRVAMIRTKRRLKIIEIAFFAIPFSLAGMSMIWLGWLP